MSLRDDIARYANGSGWNVAIPDVLVKEIEAGLESDYYLVKLADLPEVTEHQGPDGPHMLCGHTWVTVDKTADECEQRANEYAAIAVAKRARESEAAALQARRDELARACSPYSARYNDISTTAQTAIDRIIAAEAELARVKGERG